VSSHHKTHLPEGIHVIAYHAMLDVPRELAGYVSRLLAAQRRTRGTRRNSRALICWNQSLVRAGVVPQARGSGLAYVILYGKITSKSLRSPQ
jgi:hypothetical protein